MIHRIRSYIGLFVLLTVAACTGRRSGPGTILLPAPAVGALNIQFAYPKVSDTVSVSGDTVHYHARQDQRFPRVDSVFVFGTVGRGVA